MKDIIAVWIDKKEKGLFGFTKKDPNGIIAGHLLGQENFAKAGREYNYYRVPKIQPIYLSGNYVYFCIPDPKVVELFGAMALNHEFCRVFWWNDESACWHKFPHWTLVDTGETYTYHYTVTSRMLMSNAPETREKRSMEMPVRQPVETTTFDAVSPAEAAKFGLANPRHWVAPASVQVSADIQKTERFVGNGLVIEKTERDGSTPWWWISNENPNASKSTSPTYLNKDTIKAYGGRWHGTKKMWYIVSHSLPQRILDLVGPQETQGQKPPLVIDEVHTPHPLSDTATRMASWQAGAMQTVMGDTAGKSASYTGAVPAKGDGTLLYAAAESAKRLLTEREVKYTPSEAAPVEPLQDFNEEDLENPFA